MSKKNKRKIVRRITIPEIQWEMCQRMIENFRFVESYLRDVQENFASFVEEYVDENRGYNEKFDEINESIQYLSDTIAEIAGSCPMTESEWERFHQLRVGKLKCVEVSIEEIVGDLDEDVNKSYWSKK